MDVNLRRVLVDEVLPTGFGRPVVVSQKGIETPAPLVTEKASGSTANTQKSLVETTRIITKDKDGKITKAAVTLVNFTGHPIAELDVQLSHLPTPKSIKSVVQGAVKFAVEGNVVRLTVPVDVADMLLVDF